jgi:putative ABC transport system permease protein
MRALVRDLRAGELTVLLLSIVVAVAAMTAVGFFTDRVGRAMKSQAAEVLAADLVIRSADAIPDDYLARAEAAGLATAQTVFFPTVVLAGEDSSLAAIRGVSEAYPLRGEVKVSGNRFGDISTTSQVPAPGTAWAEPGLLARLGVDTGVVVQVGEISLEITQVLEYRPDQGLGFVTLAPSLMVNFDDVARMDVLRPGSRVTWRQLYAGGEDAVSDFREEVKSELGEKARLQTIEDTSEQVGAAIDRAQRFLTLASLVTVILAAVATAMASRRYALRHLDTVALMKTMGASQSFVQNSTLVQLATMTVATAIIGTLAGFGAQAGLTAILGDLIGVDLPPASLGAATLGVLTAATVAIGFALPYLLKLRVTPPMRVLRHDLPPPPMRATVTWGVAIAALVGMVLLIVRDLQLVLYISLGLGAMALVTVACGWALVSGLSRIRGAAGVAWRYGLANVARRRGESVVQIVAFGLGLMVLLLLALVRNDLLDDWRATLPEDAPNYFLINIQPDEWNGLSGILESDLGKPPDHLPLIRGRLVAINETSIQDYTFPSMAAEQRVRNEANLSWSATLPESNRIVAGEWWGEDYSGPAQASLADDEARQLGVGIGDVLTYDIGGERIEAQITSVRFVEWDSFEPNFYVMMSPGAAEQVPQTYLSSLYVPPEKRAVLNRLVRAYPAVSVLDLEVMLDQVRRVMDQASLAVQYVFLFTIGAGIVVLLAAIQVTRDERRMESAILHTLGAARAVILKGIAAEFITLGALAGILAALGATAISYALSVEVFDLDFVPDASLWLTGLLLGAALVGITGTLATRRAVTEPPVVVLRET